ncbi:MAG: hypothetical protein BAJATHORv1_30300 [Candidatus Thorarchaeota archaeon]|nr:MAG: hypothetical protein BAJATHORv1_30300 [Candidatus Thorarchaeota archaeon]
MLDPSDSPDSNLLHACMSMLATINNGMEDLLGPASKGVIFNTGVEQGKLLGVNLQKAEDFETAIDTVNEAYKGVWNVELYKSIDQDSFIFEDEMGREAAKIIVKDCPVRKAVELCELQQEGPICYLTNGYLCGMLSQLTGKKIGMEILKAGPKSCLKQIHVRK